MSDQPDKQPDLEQPPPDTDQPTPVRHGMAARITALGFIILIVLGNIWVAEAITGSPLPAWFSTVSQVGIIMVFSGGTVLAVQFVKRYFDHE